jgi:hypothetical protein
MNLIIGISAGCNIAILNNAMAAFERLFKVRPDFQYYYATNACGCHNRYKN